MIRRQSTGPNDHETAHRIIQNWNFSPYNKKEQNGEKNMNEQKKKNQNASPKSRATTVWMRVYFAFLLWIIIYLNWTQANSINPGCILHPLLRAFCAMLYHNFTSALWLLLLLLLLFLHIFLYIDARMHNINKFYI